ncbi:primase-helicase family protein [Burkholderia gladioli]|uniref:primase-helicase family protein n=1 Tax=Burkholderia gladioli TaxID=28095 RepID=UPI003EE1C0C7
MVETWIALNVREPGRLIGVALLVKGVQGDGKTIVFSDLMTAIMGPENVGLIANKEMSSDFSGWAVGRALRVVEELKAPGHNRHDMLNSVKPNITNSTVRVVRKGQDGFDALNTTNYVCLTNYEDALPLDDTDRRWWVIFSPFTDIAQLREQVGDLTAYFDALGAAIREHGDELRKYFLECELDARVHHHMRAPATEGRARMIQAENQLAGGDYLDGYITSGGEYGISADIVASSELRRCLLRDMDEGVPQSTKIKRLLQSRGFHQCVKVIKWMGAAHRIYVRDPRLVNATNDEVGRQRLRSMLDETVKNNQLAESSNFDVAGN